MDPPTISPGSQRKPLRRNAIRACAAAILAIAAGRAIAADPKLLPPEQAFRFSARALDDRTIEARFAVADGYYLYRDKFGFALEPATATLGAPGLPAGKVKDDPFFGKVETYRGDIVIALPLNAPAAGQSVVVSADSQGCADAGICYPANRQKVTLVMPAAGKGPGPLVEANPRKKNWFN
jgi:thiol:disulfide interchange protein DsbD